MPRKHKVVPIAPGIWRDGDQLVAEIRIGSSRDGTQQRLQQRWPLGTELQLLQAWQLEARAAGLRARPVQAAKGSLAADISTWLQHLPEGPYRQDAAGLLVHWQRSPLGQKARQELTRLDITGQLNRWLEGSAGLPPVATNTRNKRLSRLRVFFQELDPGQPHPTDGIKFLREPEREARSIPAHIVRLILQSLPDLGRAQAGGARPAVSQTKIRLRVMAWTGMAPSTLKRVVARDLDLAQARIRLHPRKKGQGTGRDSTWVALLPEAVQALRDFQAAGLLGKSWARSSMYKTWQRGINRAIKAAQENAAVTGDQTWLTELQQLPPRCHPYDLRHSFGSEVYRLTGDIQAVAELLQHTDLETTKRYTKGAVSERVAAAIKAVAQSTSPTPDLPKAASPTKKNLRIVRKVAS